ncbi:hypothetical protein [Croceitalea rosinachiae]|uniref:Uncharacterized protein n=1 Tax=Croceitalea rosinachiae TaxID=3075596 RepID=A0ABU3ACV7_9FLAO|nr:hypothetical protein [Croceitalea sp. F388]MDT0608020.1 hypothetical protein [Croceitalea sp. F388]
MSELPKKLRGRVPFTVMQNDTHNVILDKYYVFSQTGNIMMSTTVANSTQIEDDVKTVFNEVNVFFAALTKAMELTKIPGKGESYDIFHYSALKKIIDYSGSFIQLQKESIHHDLSRHSTNFSEELLLGVIGLATDKTLISFAQSMVASMGKAGLTIGTGSEKDSEKVSNIIFVCEYLMGMPLVTALVIYVKSSEVREYVKVGPCFGYSSDTATMTINKDAYLFVVPDIVKEYSQEILQGENDPAFNKLVDNLREALRDAPPGLINVRSTTSDNIISDLVYATDYNLLIQGLKGISIDSIQITLDGIRANLTTEPSLINPLDDTYFLKFSFTAPSDPKAHKKASFEMTITDATTKSKTTVYSDAIYTLKTSS